MEKMVDPQNICKSRVAAHGFLDGRNQILGRYRRRYDVRVAAQVGAAQVDAEQFGAGSTRWGGSDIRMRAS
jgi:hypothetical protein